jgi:hypothetical protein
MSALETITNLLTGGGAGLIGGALTRIATAGLDIYKLKMEAEERVADRAHELDMTKLQIEAAKGERADKLTAVESQGDIDLLKMSTDLTKPIAPLVRLTGIKGVDAFIAILVALVDTWNAAMRPLITTHYVLFGYSILKYAQWWVLTHSDGVPWQQAIITIITPADVTVVFSILSFWFVDRNLRHDSVKR